MGIKQLMGPIDFHIVPMGSINYFGYPYSSKYLILCKNKNVYKWWQNAIPFSSI